MPFHVPGDLPALNPALVSPALAGGFFAVSTSLASYLIYILSSIFTAVLLGRNYAHFIDEEINSLGSCSQIVTANMRMTLDL